MRVHFLYAREETYCGDPVSTVVSTTTTLALATCPDCLDQYAHHQLLNSDMESFEGIQ